VHGVPASRPGRPSTDCGNDCSDYGLDDDDDAGGGAIEQMDDNVGGRVPDRTPFRWRLNPHINPAGAQCLH
jgi:hypothetical protein